MKAVRIPLQRYHGPSIKMVNELFERPHGMLEAMGVELGGITAKVPLRCVETNSSYELLLRMDWLKQTQTTPEFGKEEYRLGGVTRVR